VRAWKTTAVRGGRRVRLILSAVSLLTAVGAFSVTATVGAPTAAAAAAPLWGIDTIDNTQSSNDIPQTQADLGNPQFVGRYFIWGGGPTIGSAEVQYLHSQGLPILLLDSSGNAMVGSAAGTSEGQNAVAQAASLGVPSGRALFRDVEAGASIDAAYIAAYDSAFQGSGYVPGFYENPLSGRHFGDAYCGAVAGNSAIGTQTVLFSSEPEQDQGDPSRAAMPSWNPAVPQCAQTTVAWQYEEHGLFPPGTQSPNVDVAEYDPRYLNLLWGPSGSYQALPPQRILDTRGDGQRTGTCSNGCVALGADSSLDLQVEGVGGVPVTGVASVVMNVTVTNPTAVSFVTVYPAGQQNRPVASNLNFVTGETVPNLVEVALGNGGAVTLYNHAGSTDLIADVEGYVLGNPSTAGTGLFNVLAPTRIGDTRANSGMPDQGQTDPPGIRHFVQVTGQGGVPSSGVAAVVLNVTVTNATAGSAAAPNFATVFPGATATPLASNLNFVAGQTVANRVVVPVGAGNGQIWIYNKDGYSDYIVDVSGWITDGTDSNANGTLFHGVVPGRVCDTRPNTGTECSGAVFDSTHVLNAMVAGRDGLPVTGAAGAPTAVVVTVTVTNPTAGAAKTPNFVTVFPGPANAPVPVISDLNFTAGETVPNLVVVKVGADGSINLLLQQGTADVIVDVVGWYS
jgi:hypothetical protein